MPLSPGSRLGSHQLVARVREDGGCEIWRARDEALGRTVAVQVLGTAPDRLQSVAGLRHPNLRAIHDVGSESGVGFLVLEMLSGETLAERLARSSLPLGTILELASGIAAGLEALHEAGLVHGNLDPEKVFLAGGAPKLVDYGFGRTLRSFVPALPRGALSHSADLPPNFGYLSPEEIRGECADARSDVFSFGTILDEMLSGPLSLGSPQSPGPIGDLISQAPSSLRHVVARCLAADPDDRFQTAGELRIAIEDVVLEKRRSESSRLAIAAAHRRRIAAGWAIAAGIVVATFVDGIRSSGRKPGRDPGATFTGSATTHVASSDDYDSPSPLPEHGSDPDFGSSRGAGE